MKWMKLERTIYPVTIYFCQGGTIGEIQAKMKRLGLKPDEELEKNARGLQLGWTLKMTDALDQFAVLIWIGKVKRTPRHVAILTHECLHAVYYTFEYIGQGLPCHEDQELATYYLDYLVGQSLAFFWKPQLNTVDF